MCVARQQQAQAQVQRRAATHQRRTRTRARTHARPVATPQTHRRHTAGHDSHNTSSRRGSDGCVVVVVCCCCRVACVCVCVCVRVCVSRAGMGSPTGQVSVNGEFTDSPKNLQIHRGEMACRTLKKKQEWCHLKRFDVLIPMSASNHRLKLKQI